MDGKILVAGGGIGVPPMLLTAKCADAADAVLGFRNAERQMLTDAFAAVCGKVLCMSDDGSCGQQGYVADGVRQMLAQERYAAVMACRSQNDAQDRGGCSTRRRRCRAMSPWRSEWDVVSAPAWYVPAKPGKTGKRVTSMCARMARFSRQRRCAGMTDLSVNLAA